MASTDSNTNLAKKRNSFLSHILSTKNLSIFRNKSSINDISKNSKLYQSHHDINSEQRQIPICISRGWLKKRSSQRPISLDLDIVKDFLINNNEHFIEQQPPPRYQKYPGTIID